MPSNGRSTAEVKRLKAKGAWPAGRHSFEIFVVVLADAGTDGVELGAQRLGVFGTPSAQRQSLRGRGRDG